MKTELNEAISATFIHNTCNRDSSSSLAALFWKREMKHFLRRPKKSNLQQTGKIIEREIHLFCHFSHSWKTNTKLCSPSLQLLFFFFMDSIKLTHKTRLSWQKAF